MVEYGSGESFKQSNTKHFRALRRIAGALECRGRERRKLMAKPNMTFGELMDLCGPGDKCEIYSDVPNGWSRRQAPLARPRAGSRRIRG